MTLEEQILEIAAKGAQSAFNDFQRVYEAQMLEQEKRILASMKRMLEGAIVVGNPPAPVPVPTPAPTPAPAEVLTIVNGKLAVNGVVDQSTNNVVAVGAASGYTSVHRNAAGDWWARKNGTWTTLDSKLVTAVPTISGGAQVSI